MSIIKVKTGGITADAITDALIADDVVGTEHLTANEVDTTALGADAVTGAQLADDAVNSEHYTDGSVDTAHIADANVTTAKIAADAITAAKIADDAISEEHLDATVITGMTELAAEPADTDEFLISDAGTLKRIDYSHIKGGGITMADQWRPASAQTGGADTLYNTWERIDTNSVGYIGSAMSHSSGTFTFPSTGRYWIQFRATMTNTATSADYQGVKILTTTDNSSYSTAAIAYESAEASNNYMTMSCSILFNCSNTSTHKVQFQAAAVQQGTPNLVGGTNETESEVIFIRLGD
jgi:hypothetical protein